MVLFGRNENRLQEKRQVLISLHSYSSDRVNNVRIPSEVPNGPTVLPNNHIVDPQPTLHVYRDESASGDLAGGPPPKSIISVAKAQEAPEENTLKAVPWTHSVPHKKRILASRISPGPSFTVREDDPEEVLRGCLPAGLPSTCREDYSNWHVALVNFPDEPSPHVVFGYPKHRVYIDPQTEYSIEELRATRYRKNLNAIQPVETQQAVQSILIDDDEDDDCILVSQDPPFMEQEVEFKIHEDTPAKEYHSANTSVRKKITSTVRHSPWKSQAEHQNFLQDVFSKSNEFRISSALPPEQSTVPANSVRPVLKEFRLVFTPQKCTQPTTGEFSFYEPLTQDIPPQMPSKGNAMKTTFGVLNADEVETGSRGGMDGAMAAQPADGAKPMASVPDNSSSSYGDAEFVDSIESTQQFNFHLNAMQVSTPLNKVQVVDGGISEQKLQNSKKRLFSECIAKEKDKILSTIIEEKSGFVSSSSSSGLNTKSYGQQPKMNTISEEHNSYLAQNLKANAALRRTLLGGLIDNLEDVLPSDEVVSPPSPMQSTPVQSPVRKIPPVARPLDYVPSDPFSPSLISKLLDRVSFPEIHREGFVQIDGNPKVAVKKEPVHIGSDQYVIEKILGKGQFGTVFKAYNYQSGCTVALKYQKPPNKWEYYICKELQARLVDHPLRDRFMEISIGYFSDQASILVLQYQPLGSLLDTANLLKKTATKETTCMYFTLEMLKIVKAMHEVKIIHADIKPDNFLVILLPNNSLSLQLIDFGCSIDMTLFPDEATFTRPITTEDFICCEVRDGRPWSYHTDLFCVAASAHVLFFIEYIQLKKTNNIWHTVKHFPRYTKVELWNMFFNTLLNQQSGPPDVATLEFLFKEELELPQRKRELPEQHRILINLLKNR